MIPVIVIVIWYSLCLFYEYLLNAPPVENLGIESDQCMSQFSIYFSSSKCLWIKLLLIAQNRCQSQEVQLRLNVQCVRTYASKFSFKWVIFKSWGLILSWLDLENHFFTMNLAMLIKTSCHLWVSQVAISVS